MAYRGNRRIATGDGLSLRDRLFLAVYCVLLFAGALFYIWVQARVVEASVQLSSLRHQERVLRSRNEELRVEIATLRSPAVLSRVATEELKMVTPAPGQIRMVGVEPARKR